MNKVSPPPGHTPDEITKAMNRALDEIKPCPDPFVAETARILERTEW